MEIWSKKDRGHVYNKKAPLTYEEVMWFYEQGAIAAKMEDGGDRKAVENKVFEKLYNLFPERRDKQLNWKLVNDSLADHVPMEVRQKILGKLFS